MTGERTEAETDLLDVADWATSLGMDAKERRTQLGNAINAVLVEAVRDGYRLRFAASDGVYLRTPSGVLVWFLPECPCGSGADVIVDSAGAYSKYRTMLDSEGES